MTILPDRIGRYRVRALIGRGAMGAVYAAEDPELGREVAVKVVLEEVHHGDREREEVFQRFLREARIGARLVHPNIVTVYDAGRDGDRFFLVMELVRGESLQQRIARGDFPDLFEALDIAAQTAEALAHAHAAGVIHRDIKPANLLITAESRVKVADFGVAKAISESTELTRTGMMVGSPAYMSPEQIRGAPLDSRSDLFSLGVILYELLLRRKPFPADTVTALVFQILNEDPLSDPTLGDSLPGAVADLLRWTLAKDREQRIPEARLLVQRLRELQGELRGGPPSAGGSERTGTHTRAQTLIAERSAGAASGSRVGTLSRRTRFALLAGLGLLVVASLVAYWWQSPPDRPVVGSELVPVDLPDALPQPVDRPQVGAGADAATAPPEAASTLQEPAAGPLASSQPPPARPQPTPEPVRLGWPAEPTPAPVVEAPASPDRLEEGVAAAPAPAAPAPAVWKTFVTRRAVKFDVDPEEALLEIDGRVIGTADDWDGMGGAPAYEFKQPGSYLVRIFLQGYETVWVRIEVRPDAKRDVVSVDPELRKAKSKN